MAKDDYNPTVGLIQTAAQVAGRVHAGEGDIQKWHASFETILALLQDEAGGGGNAESKSVAASPAPVPASSNSSSVAPPPPAPKSVQGDGGPSKQDTFDFMAQNPHLVFYTPENESKGWAVLKVMDKAGGEHAKRGVWYDSGLKSFKAHDGNTYEYDTPREAVDAVGAMVQAAKENAA